MIASPLLTNSNWPRRPYCSDHIESGLIIRPFEKAIQKKYIQANRPGFQGWLIFDVDRVITEQDIDWLGLPQPTWFTQNKQNCHAHICYGLHTPVFLNCSKEHLNIVRYCAAIESAIANLLQADSCYVGLMTKTPFHSEWRSSISSRLYQLGDLAEYVDLSKPVKTKREFGLGRNVTIFDDLRTCSYRKVRVFLEAGNSYEDWYAYLYEKACFINNTFPTPLSFREVSHIVKSVAKWSWFKFDLAESDRRFSKKQAARGKKGGLASGKARFEAAEEKAVSARLMAAEGMTQKQIAHKLGVSDRTIRNWLAKPDAETKP